ncbi:hypothetical protein FXO37_24286 [Capsicum annuum]|nr:hypothetical protein FXO37_24286 [Capsicum annuum]
MQESIAADKTLTYKWCPKCSLRSEVSAQAKNIRDQQCRFIKVGENFGSNLVVEIYRMKKVAHIPGSSIEGQPAATRNLNELLRILEDDKSVSDFGQHLGLRFSKLRQLDISQCASLTCLFNDGGACSVPKNLEEITINVCLQLVELYVQCNSSDQVALVNTEIPRVRKLKLYRLPELGMLGEPQSMWEHLEELKALREEKRKNLLEAALKDVRLKTFGEIKPIDCTPEMLAIVTQRASMVWK